MQGVWFLIYAKTITHSCIKRGMLERGIYDRVGLTAGKFHLRGAVEGIQQGGGLDRGSGRGSKKGPPAPVH